MTMEWQRREPRTPPPLTPDAVVRRTDQVKSRPAPAALGSLISTNCFFVPGAARNEHPEKLLRPLQVVGRHGGLVNPRARGGPGLAGPGIRAGCAR